MGLKIAVLIKNFNRVGGAEKYAVETTRRLAQRKHEISLYSWAADAEAVSGLRFHKVPNRMRFSSVLNLYAFSREVSRLMKGKNYDVVLSHDRTSSQDIAVIHTFSYKSGVDGYSLLRKIDQLYLSPRSGLHLWLDKRQMNSSWLVAVSEKIREDIHNFYDRRDHVDVITPGIDIQKFTPSFIAENRDRIREEEGFTENEMVVLFVGSEFKRKGLDRLIPAIKGPMRLLVAGRGEKLGYYQGLAEKHGAGRKVRFLGLVSDVNRYYAASDVVVLPSRIEAFGISLLEGMACGLPVITSAGTGCADLIDSGVNGFISHHENDLSDIFNRLRDPDLRKAVGIRARALAEKHTWDATADLYEKLCFQVAGEKNRSPGGPQADKP